MVAAVLLPDVKMRWFPTLKKFLPNVSEEQIFQLVIRSAQSTLTKSKQSLSKAETFNSSEFFEFDGKIAQQIGHWKISAKKIRQG